MHLEPSVLTLGYSAPPREKTMANISDDDIRRRAYALWEQDGRPDGNHQAHWDRAHQELLTGTPETPAEATPAAKARKTSGTKSPSLSVVPKNDTSSVAPRKRGKI